MASAIISYVKDSSQWVDGTRLSKFTVTCRSATGGAATLSIPNFNGWWIKTVTDPGATAPTDNYDITMIDELGADAAEGLLIDRDTANTETKYMNVTGGVVPLLVNGTHTFTVANAGDEKDFVCTMYLVDHI